MQNYNDWHNELIEVLTCNSNVAALNNEAYVSFYNAGDIKCNQWLLTLEEGRRYESVIPVLSRNRKPLMESKSATIAQDAKVAWCYLNDSVIGNRYKTRLERLFSYQSYQNIYALASIYSELEEDKLLVINNSHNPLPMKVWLNDQLCFVSFKEHRMRRQELRVHLQKGINTVLVERSILPEQKIKDMFMDTSFSICFHSVDFLSKKEGGEAYADRIRDKEVSLRVTKGNYEEAEEIGFVVLGYGYFKSKTFTVRAEDLSGNQCEMQQVEEGELVSWRLPEEFTGLIQLEVLQEDNSLAKEYVLIGKYTENMKENMEFLSAMEVGRQVVRNSIYPIDANVYYYLYDAIWQELSCRNFRKERIHEPGYHLNFVTTHCLGERRQYGLYLPKGYKKEKAYPLIIEYVSCYGEYAIPGLNGNEQSKCFRNLEYEEAMIAVVPCLYEKYNPMEVVVFYDVLQEIWSRYDIDARNIHLVGFCGGANCCVQVLQMIPKVFATFTLIAPYIEEKLLEQWKPDPNLKLELICNPATGLFLSQQRYRRLLSQASMYITSPLEHEEVETFYLSKRLLHRIAQESKCYPADRRELSFSERDCGLIAIYTKPCIIATIAEEITEYSTEEQSCLSELLECIQMSYLGMKVQNLKIREIEEFTHPASIVQGQTDQVHNMILIQKEPSLSEAKKSFQVLWEQENKLVCRFGSVQGIKQLIKYYRESINQDLSKLFQS